MTEALGQAPSIITHTHIHTRKHTLLSQLGAKRFTLKSQISLGTLTLDRCSVPGLAEAEKKTALVHTQSYTVVYSVQFLIIRNTMTPLTQGSLFPGC